ncbi:DUF7472 family protein [Natronolimnohabitans innermongolicus]|uniref:Uncharacterized protein n=1 Tax=Natronolimnohabitans innermongolicus JCM 12255 TaxID=1227499 RepID=L9X2R4_9EURY|nr:hypothetical protein [Natronolimnohabitans innermongolicus]ELY55771.1 hypothetical protein C493_10912 [Natronolimnohabitans innermongolicus JCM 12255]
MLERERIIEIVVSVTAVFIMLGVMWSIGTEYAGDDSILTPEGGELLVGAIVGFIFLLLVIGVALAFLLNDPENNADNAI